MITKLRFLLVLLFIAGLKNAFGQAPIITSFSPSAGAVGTLVTLNGSNLNKAISFSIGYQNAIVISKHVTSAVVMVMPNAATGPVSANIADSALTVSSGFTVVSTNAQFGQQGSKLVASGGSESSSQGWSVAVSADGNTAIVGAPYDNNGQGCAWVYTRNGGVWTQQGGKLVGTGGIGTLTQVGYSVAISADGNTAIIGGVGDNAGGNSPTGVGAAWIFVRTGTTWAQQGSKLVGSGAVGYGMQGWSVSMSADGNTAMVAGHYDNNSQGAVWVYSRTGTIWTQQGNKLVAVGNTGGLGESISLSADGNTAIFGGGGGNSFIGAGFIFSRSGNTWTQQAELVGSNDGSEEREGYAVAISADGNTAIICGPDDNNFIGAAWVFIRTGSVWSQQGGKLVNSEATRLTSFATTVSLSADGNTAIIGAPNDNTYQGAAWVFARNNGLWAQQGSKLVGNGIVGEAQFGVSISVSSDGNTAIMGGVVDNSYQGAAWVFSAPPPAISSFSPAVGAPGTVVTINGTGLGGIANITIGGQGAIIISNTSSQLVAMVMPNATTGAISLMTTNGTTTSSAIFNVTPTKYPTAQQGGKLVGTGASGASTQGFAVAISADGNTAIVGGSSDNSNQGAVWVYTRSAGTWTQQGAKLVPAGNIGAAAFGASVALSADGNTALVGGVGDNSNIGAAWVFTRSNGVWSQQGSKLVGNGSVGASNQGVNVALSADGNTAIIAGNTDNSLQGAVWVFTRIGGVWAQQGPKLVGSGSVGAAHEGSSVALSADGYTLAIGGLSDNSSNGAAWIFIRSGNSWSQQGAKLVGTGNSGIANQGTWVAISADGNTVMETGMSDNAGIGAAWIFTRSGTSWTQQGSKLVGTGSVGSSQQGSGASISADGNTAVLGGPGDNSSQGAAWIFTRSNGIWTQQGSKLTGTGNSGTAYQAVALSLSANGTTLISGGGEDNSFQGAAWIFNASSDATLSALTISKGLLSPAFKSTTASYSVTETNAVSSIALVPTLNDDNATVTVNGVVVTSGNASSPIALNVGTNNINVQVIAADGITTKAYTLTVTRPASNNDNLSNLKLNAGAIPLSPAFNYATNSYTASVPNATTSIKVIPATADVNATVKINGTLVKSGTASGPLPLKVGANTVNAIVTAQNGTSTKLYTVTVTRAPSSNANLTNLTLNGDNTLVPAFSPAQTSYTTTLPYGKSIISLTPACDTTAKVTVGGVPVTSGYRSQKFSLNVGSNPINIVVTAQDGVTTKTYTVNVIRSLPANANLTNLKISAGTLSPAFIFTTNAYTASVANAIASIKVTPFTSDALAKVTVNGMAVISGKASTDILLNVGPNPVTTIVTAQDGSTNTYTITITRAPSSNDNLTNLTLNGDNTLVPAFSPAQTSYTTTLPYGKTVISLTPACDTTATIKVNGLSVTSGYRSQKFSLNVGSNPINIVVTAQDGVTTKTYTVNVIRSLPANANLTNLKINGGTLSPAFIYTTTTYTASVANAIASIKVTPVTSDALAKVTVNGIAVSSGIASPDIPLTVGPNSIITIITAQDGSTNTYTITVTRAPSSNANLTNVTISSGTLSPAFATGTTSYTATAGIASITVTPTTSDATAKVKVNGTAVTSGTASGAISLVVGSNTITTIVTAQDGTTTSTYTITATRLSNNANLANLKINNGTIALSPAFNFNTTGYTAIVPGTMASIKIIPVIADANATIKINGTTVVSGTASASVPLLTGPNTITTVVTAQDGTTTKTYTITVTRSGPVANPLAAISVSQPVENLQREDDGITVHQGLSPNGDGQNDFLIIDGIVKHPENKLLIMNRNGVLIFEATGYNNSTRIFDGHSNKNGKMQPPGTYFYSLAYKVKGVLKRKTGFVVLKY